MRDVLRNERKFLMDLTKKSQLYHRLAQLLHEDKHNGPEGYLVRSLLF